MEYIKSNIKFEEPIVELGCGNGIFSIMLVECSIIEKVDFAIDYDLEALKEAKSRQNWFTLRGDITNLPLKNNSISSIYSNGVICCLKSKNASGVRNVLKESSRVLKDDGLIIMTVATPWFIKNLSTVKILKKLRLHSLSFRYIKSFEERLTHHHVIDEKDWRKKFDDVGFYVEGTRYFFTPRQGFVYGILSLQIFLFFGIFKFSCFNWSMKIIGNFLKAMFKPIIKKEQNLSNELKSEKAGYILFILRKKQKNKQEK